MLVQNNMMLLKPCDCLIDSLCPFVVFNIIILLLPDVGPLASLDNMLFEGELSDFGVEQSKI